MAWILTPSIDLVPTQSILMRNAYLINDYIKRIYYWIYLHYKKLIDCKQVVQVNRENISILNQDILIENGNNNESVIEY